MYSCVCGQGHGEHAHFCFLHISTSKDELLFLVMTSI